jgi:uncharacterized protein YbaP (TraB family)
MLQILQASIIRSPRLKQTNKNVEHLETQRSQLPLLSRVNERKEQDSQFIKENLDDVPDEKFLFGKFGIIGVVEKGLE